MPRGKARATVGRSGTALYLRGHLRHQNISITAQLRHVAGQRKQVRCGKPTHIHTLTRAHGRSSQAQGAGAERHDTSQAATPDKSDRNIRICGGPHKTRPGDNGRPRQGGERDVLNPRRRAVAERHRWELRRAR